MSKELNPYELPKNRSFMRGEDMDSLRSALDQSRSNTEFRAWCTRMNDVVNVHLRSIFKFINDLNKRMPMNDAQIQHSFVELMHRVLLDLDEQYGISAADMTCDTKDGRLVGAICIMKGKFSTTAKFDLDIRAVMDPVALAGRSNFLLDNGI